MRHAPAPIVEALGGLRWIEARGSAVWRAGCRRPGGLTIAEADKGYLLKLAALAYCLAAFAA